MSVLEDRKKTRSVNRETEEALNYILPPREWEENGVQWRQKVKYFLLRTRGLLWIFLEKSWNLFHHRRKWIPINKINSKIVERPKRLPIFSLIIFFQVSSDPVTRNDVIKLTEQLDIRLQQSQAKMLGICPIRRELFTQCFGKN